MRRHTPLIIATALVITVLIGCTWWLGSIISASSVSERTVEDIGNRLEALEVHLENIDASTCSIDKHFMSGSEQLADMNRRCH